MAGDVPGKAGDARGKAGDVPGKAGAARGMAGDVPGNMPTNLRHGTTKLKFKPVLFKDGL